MLLDSAHEYSKILYWWEWHDAANENELCKTKNVVVCYVDDSVRKR